MRGLGITPEKVARAIWLYRNGEPLASIQKATTIPLKHLKRIIAKHDLAFGDDSWEQLFARQLTRALQGLEKAMEAEE